MKLKLRAYLALLALVVCVPTFAGDNLGDFAPGTTAICGQYTTYNASLAPTTLAGTPVISIYKIGDGVNSATESTTGITHAEDVDSRTGLNRFCVDTSADGTFYSAGAQFSVIITTGTVNSVSVVGSEVKSFSLRKGTVAGIPNATAGASGGLQIAGSNAATTYATMTVTGATTLSDGLVVARSTSNSPAATFTGNGTGNGITVTSGSGATGTALALAAASTNGAALTATGTGTGNGATFTSGSGATGNGAQFTAASTNGNGVGLTATGTGATMTIAPSNVQQINGTTITTLTGAYPSLGIVDSGTAQAATATTLQIRSAATFADNELTGASCIISGGTTGVGQSRTVSSSVGSTDTLTVPTWTTTPTGTITYVCYGTAPGSGGAAPSAAQVATAVWQDTTSGDFTVSSSIGKSLYTTGATPGASGGLQIAGSNAATTYADFDVTANVSLAGGLNITQSTANTPAFVVTGNGTGSGAVFTSGSGATGNGAQFTAASTNGNGIGLTATGTGVTQTISPANTTQIAGQTASASGTVTFPNATLASTTNITAGTITTATNLTTNNDKTGYTASTVSDKTGYTLSSAGINGILDQTLSGHTTGGTVGGALNSASSAGDPWATLLPGSYSAGTAGNIIGNRIDAATSSRMATFTLPTNFSAFSLTAGGQVTVGTNNDKTGYTASTVSDKTGYTLSAAGINAFADTSTSGHTTGGTWGGAWNAAGAAGDPWSTALPGSYAAGTAGNIVGNRLDAAISTRQATTSFPTNFNLLAIGGAGQVTVGTLSSGSITSSTFGAGAIDANAIATDAIGSAELASSATSEIVTALLSGQNVITGICDSGSTTTCVDDALTQAAASQLQDRMVCYDDNFCALISTFSPGTDTLTSTKVAPSTRAARAYTIFPTTLQ